MPPTKSRKQQSNALPYMMLAVVAFLLLTILGNTTTGFFDFMHHGAEWSRLPFVLDDSYQIIRNVLPEAKDAEIRPGDRITALNGQAYTNYQQLLIQLRDTPPGEKLHVAIQRGDSTIGDASIRLVALDKTHLSSTLWFFLAFLRVIFPLLCLLLGFWVVVAKPFDKNAWFLLGIFGFFGFIFQQTNIRPIDIPWIRDITLFGANLFMAAGLASIMLFGLYFPERSNLDRRFPWVKWAILIPFTIAFIYDEINTYYGNFDFHGPQFFFRWEHAFSYIGPSLGGLCIFFFFMGMQSNAHGATTPDTRRRLRVLYTGSAVGLGSLGILVVISQLRGSIDGFLPPWLLFVAISVPLLFPISLAYVVVVQRAMDLSILVRQGTKYAFARGTLWALQFALVAAVTYRVARLIHQPHVSQTDILFVLTLGLIFLALRLRVAGSVSNWLDRRFFREAYSTEQILSALAERARSFTETKPLIETITQSIGETLHIDRIGVLLHTGNGFHLQQAVGLEVTSPVVLRDNSSTIRHLHRSNIPATLYEDKQDGWLLLANEEERRTLRQLSAELLLPLHGRKNLVGIMALGPKRSEEPYSNTDLQLLQTVATQAGLSIENAQLMNTLANEAARRERMNREIEIAREVQERLFPQALPEIPGAECTGACRPAQGVGGDYYDFLELESGRIGIAVGDVSGKGISAALLMASLRASLRGIVLSGTSDLAMLMRNINRLVYDSSASNRYATFFFGEYDPHTRMLTYVNAGHNEPMVLRRRQDSGNDAKATPCPENCQVLRLAEGGPVVGMLPETSYICGTVVLHPGDVLLAYTDGISEAMNKEDEEWGEERMIEAACACLPLSASVILEHVFNAADAFTQGAPQHDDMTLAVLKLDD